MNDWMYCDACGQPSRSHESGICAGCRDTAKYQDTKAELAEKDRQLEEAKALLDGASFFVNLHQMENGEPNQQVIDFADRIRAYLSEEKEADKNKESTTGKLIAFDVDFQRGVTSLTISVTRDWDKGFRIFDEFEIRPISKPIRLIEDGKSEE